MKIIKQLIHIFIVTSILLGFVNCSFQNALSLKFPMSNKLSGNGGGYEGKPDGTYYRYVPNYTCSGQPAAEGIAEFIDGLAYLYDNNSSQCSTQSSPVLASDINLSPFQNEFISIRDELFKRYETKPLGIPNSLAEILCRDDFSSPTFEIVSHYNRETFQAENRVYFSDHIEPDFQTGRILSATEVQYLSEKLQFKVDFSKPSLPNKKFSGFITASTIPGLASKNLTCVIGGSLDTTNWKLTQLTDLSTNFFSFIGKGEILFSYTISNFVHQMYKIDADNTVTNFTEKLLGSNFDSEASMATDDPNLFVFQGRPLSELYQSWFAFDQSTSVVHRLTNLGSGHAIYSYLLNAPDITANRHLIYLEIGSAQTNKYILHDFDLNTDTNHDIATDGQLFNYTTLRKSNRVVLIDFSVKPVNQFQIYDTETQNISRSQIQMPDGCQLTEIRMENYINDNEIAGIMTCGASSEPHLILLNIPTGTARDLGVNKHVSWISPDKAWLVLGDAQTSVRTTVIYNVQSGKSFTSLVNPTFGFYDANGVYVHSDYQRGDILEFIKIASVENRWLYGFNGDVFNPTLYQADLQTGLTVSSCESAIGRKLYVGVLPNQKAYLLTYDSLLRAYRFYAVKSPTDCPLLNEFPSEHPSVTYLQSTSIGFAMSMGNGNMEQTLEAVFVPTDGRPPLKMSYGDQGPWFIQVAPDKKRIILTGPAANGQIKLFSFDLFKRN